MPASRCGPDRPRGARHQPAIGASAAAACTHAHNFAAAPCGCCRQTQPPADSMPKGHAIITPHAAQPPQRAAAAAAPAQLAAVPSRPRARARAPLAAQPVRRMRCTPDSVNTGPLSSPTLRAVVASSNGFCISPGLRGGEGGGSGGRGGTQQPCEVRRCWGSGGGGRAHGSWQMVGSVCAGTSPGLLVARGAHTGTVST